MANQTRITNNRPAMLHLPPINTAEERDPKTGAVTKPANMLAGRELVPGGNNVDTDYWNRVNTNATVKQWIDLKWIKVGGDTSEPEGVQSPVSLDGMDVEAARATIASESNPANLERWQSDSRPAVREAASKRIYEVNK